MKRIPIYPFCMLVIEFLLTLACNTQRSQDVEKPKVIFISIDDLNDWIEPLGGHPQFKTPHLQEFSLEAANFKNAYCASSGRNLLRGVVLTSAKQILNSISNRQ